MGVGASNSFEYKALGRPISCNHRKPEGSDEKMRIWAVLKVKIEDAPVVFKDFRKILLFFGKNAGISRVFKG